MNFLAHIYLARHSEDAMFGALLGDFVKGNFAGKYSAPIAVEISIHRKIDVYTDHHPIVKEARALFHHDRRRYAGIALDIFYDHVLAKNWDLYCATPLQDFVNYFYASLLRRKPIWPDDLASVADRMVAQDWLGSYKDFRNAKAATKRIAHRLSRNGHLLCDTVDDLEQHYTVLAAGFQQFFPDLVEFARQERERHQAS